MPRGEAVHSPLKPVFRREVKKTHIQTPDTLVSELLLEMWRFSSAETGLPSQLDRWGTNICITNDDSLERSRYWLAVSAHVWRKRPTLSLNRWSKSVAIQFFGTSLNISHITDTMNSSSHFR